MKITLEIPDPKFKAGDVLRWGDLIVHVYFAKAEGEWDALNGQLQAEWSGVFRYGVTIQDGTGPEGDLIRPGTCLNPRENSDTLSEQDCTPEERILFSDAQVIQWDKPIIEPDDMENIGERWAAWEILHPKQEKV